MSAHSNSFKWERLDVNDAVLIVVDHQVGLFNCARDFDHSLFRDNMYAHAAIGNLFKLPTILTTSAQTGPNGPLPKEIRDMYPDAPLIERGGEVCAWDNADFREAVRATGRKQVIIAGILTDVCTTFLALAMRTDGYSVFANVEASGTTSQLARESANDQMRAAGVHVVTLWYIVADLMRDWRNEPGAAKILPWLNQYTPVVGFTAKAHIAAIREGAPMDGEEKLQYDN